jgi:hypothetical protein
MQVSTATRADSAISQRSAKLRQKASAPADRAEDCTLSGEGIEPVETCCIQALSKGKPVRLHLRDVCAIDERGRTMLRHLAAEGVGLTANGIYSSYIIDDIQSASLSKRRCSR